MAPRSMPPADRFWRHVDKVARAPCWLWTGAIGSTGYGNFGWTWKNIVNTHRAVWAITHGVFPAQHVLHRCDNRWCVNPDHLFLGSALDNMRDKVAKGRQLRGTANPGAKLTEAAVWEIRRERAQGVSCPVLAKRFNVSPSLISMAARGVVWGHLGLSELGTETYLH